jgi:hypothetical protein
LNTFTLSLLTITILSSNLSANSIEALEKRITDLEAQLEESTTENESIWEVLDEVETKAFSDKLNMSFDLRGRMDKFSYSNKGTDTQGQPQTKREKAFPDDMIYDPQYSIRGYINMNATNNSGTKFTGRIRFDHNSQGDQRICILSPQGVNSKPNKIVSSATNKFTTFDVDRAFVDLPLLQDNQISLTLSGGILPTTGGMSSNIIENTPRRSVFPTIMFDSNVYGGIGTINLSKAVGTDTYLRVIAGKAYTLNDNMFYYQCNRENIQNMDVTGLFLEVEIPLAGIDNTFWIGYNKNGNIKATPFLGFDNTENKGSNTFLKTQQALGDIANYGMGWELRDISLNETSGALNLFAHYSISDPKANGNCVNYSDSNISGGCNGIGLEANPAGYYKSDMAKGTLLTDTGYGIYAGFQYALPRKSLGTKIGYEYNKGSKYWWSATQGSEDVFNKLATRGQVHELYLIQPVTSNLYFRVGYINITEEYAGSGWHFGTPFKKEATEKDVYALFNAYF